MINNEYTINKTEAYLKTINKDMPWLLNELQISDKVFNTWKNNHKAISLDNIQRISLLLKSYQCNIHTPKQLIGLEQKFTLSKSDVQNNIKYICETSNIPPNEIFNEAQFNLPKNSVYNVLNKEIPPNYENLLKFYHFFKWKKINLINHLELIYFPLFGETEKTYLDIRNKIKIIE